MLAEFTNDPPLPKPAGSVDLKTGVCQMWQSVPSIPALGRQRQVALYGFEASLVYTVDNLK